MAHQPQNVELLQWDHQVSIDLRRNGSLMVFMIAKTNGYGAVFFNADLRRLLQLWGPRANEEAAELIGNAQIVHNQIQLQGVLRFLIADLFRRLADPNGDWSHINFAAGGWLAMSFRPRGGGGGSVAMVEVHPSGMVLNIPIEGVPEFRTLALTTLDNTHQVYQFFENPIKAICARNPRNFQ